MRRAGLTVPPRLQQLLVEGGRADPQEQVDRGRIAPGGPCRDGDPLAPALHVGQGLSEIIGEQPRRPAVREAPDAIEDTAGHPAHPDRDRPLRAGVDSRIAHPVEAPLECEQRLLPEPAQEPHLLLDAASPRAEVLTERLVLDVVPAVPDAEDQPAAGEQVDLRRLLRHQRGLPLGQDQDVRDQPQPRGHGREEAEQHQRLVNRRAVAVGPEQVRVALAIGAEHVVRRHEEVVAELLGGLRVVADRDRIAADLAFGEHDAELHALS